MSRPRHWWEVRIEELEREVEDLRAHVESAAAGESFSATIQRFRELRGEPGVPLSDQAARILWVEPRQRAAFEELGIPVEE